MPAIREPASLNYLGTTTTTDPKTKKPLKIHRFRPIPPDKIVIGPGAWAHMGKHLFETGRRRRAAAAAAADARAGRGIQKKKKKEKVTAVATVKMEKERERGEESSGLAEVKRAAWAGRYGQAAQMKTLSAAAARMARMK